MIVDHVVAGRFPAWAIGEEHQATAVGALVNLALMLALMFWPSGDSEGSYGAPPPAAHTREQAFAIERAPRAGVAGIVSLELELDGRLPERSRRTAA